MNGEIMPGCTEQPAGPGLAPVAGRSRSSLGVRICKELGLDCSFVATGKTSHEVMRTFLDHAESAHHIEVLTADVIYRVSKAIKNALDSDHPG